MSVIAAVQTAPFTRATVRAQILLDFGRRRHWLAYLSYQFAGCGRRRLAFFARQFLSRLLINNSLLPLSPLPRKQAGEKIRKEARFSQGVESGSEVKSKIVHFSTPCYCSCSNPMKLICSPVAAPPAARREKKRSELHRVHGPISTIEPSARPAARNCQRRIPRRSR